MLVTKITDGSLRISHFTFTKDVSVEVSDSLGKYIKDTFPNHFKVHGTTKETPAVKKAVSTDEPAEEAPKRTRKRKTTPKKEG